MTVTFLVPAASVAYYQGELNSNVMEDTTAVVVGEKDVTAISGLPAAKTVANGTVQKNLNLPSSLTLTIDGNPETVPVTWASRPHAIRIKPELTPLLPSCRLRKDMCWPTA